MRYDPEIKDSISEYHLNHDYFNSINQSERAALGFVATLGGSDCNYDKSDNADLSNLRCKLNDALGLGYQCSETHLGFLRTWFKNDQAALDDLEDCNDVPTTATHQNILENIALTTKGNLIVISYKAIGVEGTDHFVEWAESITFRHYPDNLKIVKRRLRVIKKG
jgi:hypothetical protein